MNVPPRVDENQRVRPYQFTEVKPNGFTRDDQTFGKCLGPIRTNCARMKSLFPNRPRAGDERNKSEWGECYGIAPADTSSLPPDAESEHNRQHHHRSLAQCCQQEGKERQDEKQGSLLP